MVHPLPSRSPTLSYVTHGKMMTVSLLPVLLPLPLPQRTSSVGMFQTSKLCLVPVIVAAEWFMLGKTVSWQRGLLLVLVVSCTAASIADDIELSALGLFWCVSLPRTV